MGWISFLCWENQIPRVVYLAITPTELSSSRCLDLLTETPPGENWYLTIHLQGCSPNTTHGYFIFYLKYTLLIKICINSSQTTKCWFIKQKWTWNNPTVLDFWPNSFLQFLNLNFNRQTSFPSNECEIISDTGTFQFGFSDLQKRLQTMRALRGKINNILAEWYSLWCDTVSRSLGKPRRRKQNIYYHRKEKETDTFFGECKTFGQMY